MTTAASLTGGTFSNWNRLVILFFYYLFYFLLFGWCVRNDWRGNSRSSRSRHLLAIYFNSILSHMACFCSWFLFLFGRLNWSFS
jgi:cytochrome bd-type quinol oxidase subunit 1